jgi:glycosyltransferase involved in cell wall biosynthesis
MKVCFFTKYPPTEGGTASRSYWYIRGLGETGVEVHVITNSLEERIWREKLDFENPEDLVNFQPENVYVHSLDNLKDSPKNISIKGDEARLASLGIEAIRNYKCEIIDSHYFFPFGISAYLVKKITGLPLILRHAGSDITRVVSDTTFHLFFKEIFSEADLILTHRERSAFFERMGASAQNLNFGFNYGVNPKYFNSHVAPFDFSKYGLAVDSKTPVISFMGKAHSSKGIYELAEAASKLKENFLLLFVSGGPGLEAFKKYVENLPELKGKYYFLEFLPPWEIPSLLKSSTCLMHLERDFPVPFHFPIQPLEAMAVGTCPVISKEIYRVYRNLPKVEEGKNILVVDPKNIKDLKDLLRKITKEKGFAETIGKEAEKDFNRDIFDFSISATIKFYEALKNRSKSFKNFLEEMRNLILKFI